MVVEQLRRMVAGVPAGENVLAPAGWLQELLEAVEAEIRSGEAGDPGAEPADLDVGAAARVAGRKPSTVRAWAPAIEGAYKVHGRDWRIPREALIRYMRGTDDRGEDDQRPASEDFKAPRRRRRRSRGGGGRGMGSWRQHRGGAS